jgi:hypothetical protein
MELNKEQIEKLFLFTEKKSVDWYDVQAEIVDHLANKIEAEMEQNASLDFETALTKVYATFGIFGFARIVKQKEEQVRKANNKLWKIEFKNQFTWPNLVRSLAIFQIILLAFKFITLDYIFISGVVAILINFIRSIRIDWKQKKSEKKLLLTKYFLFPNFLGCFYSQIFIHYWKYKRIEDISFEAQCILIALVFMVTISYLASMKVSATINKKAISLYPEAFETA